MRTVYKYILEPLTELIEIPSDKILSCESQNDTIVIYALVDTDNLVPNTYSFEVVGTGQPITFDENEYTFLNTVKMVNDRYIFHIFYRKIN